MRSIRKLGLNTTQSFDASTAARASRTRPSRVGTGQTTGHGEKATASANMLHIGWVHSSETYISPR